MSGTSAPSNLGGVFATTRWSLVVEACQQGTAEAEHALETLCRTYWPPLYAFIRRQGYSAHDAEDLTQEFFRRFLARRDLATADRSRGRFRSYLLGAVKHFLANEWDRAQAQKRGGGAAHIALDTGPVESRLGVEPAHAESPDRIYERQWALTLLDRVLVRLRQEQAAEGKLRQFEALKVTLTTGKGAVPMVALAAQLGLSEGAAKVAAHRLRKRYRALLRSEVRDTVATDEEVEDELRHLLQALGGV